MTVVSRRFSLTNGSHAPPRNSSSISAAQSAAAGVVVNITKPARLKITGKRIDPSESKSSKLAATAAGFSPRLTQITVGVIELVLQEYFGLRVSQLEADDDVRSMTEFR